MNRFGLTQEQVKLIKKLIETFLPDSKVYVFGSRSRGDHKRYSDLDLAVESKSPIAKEALSALQEQFTESTLPFKVDLIELLKIDTDFRNSIQEDLIEF